jgi:hypothetical protein
VLGHLPGDALDQVGARELHKRPDAEILAAQLADLKRLFPGAGERSPASCAAVAAPGSVALGEVADRLEGRGPPASRASRTSTGWLPR